MLDQRSKSIAMCRDENLFSILNFGYQILLPFNHETILSDFQRFSKWKILFGDILVHRIIAWVMFGGFVGGWRGNIIRSSPNQHLILSVFVDRFLLVQSLKSTIVPFIQSPCIDDGNVHEVHFLQNDPKRFDGTLQGTRVAKVKGEASLLEQDTAGLGLGFSLFT